MLSSKLGHPFDGPLSPVTDGLSKIGLHPNVLTLLGLSVNVAAAAELVMGRLRWAGVLILVGGMFDVVDGAMARNTGAVSKFGEFFDSVVDRYSDLIIVSGLVIYFTRQGDVTGVVLVCVVLAGFVLIPFIRARAEASVARCNVGLMERAERIIVLSVSLIFNGLTYGLWILAVLTHFTAVHRLWYTWKTVRQSEQLEQVEPSPAAEHVQIPKS